MEIPYANTREIYQPETVSKVSRSWFEELRRLFSLSPAFSVSASFAIVAVCFGIIFFANKSSNNADIAGVNSKNTNQTVSISTVEKENFPVSTND